MHIINKNSQRVSSVAVLFHSRTVRALPLAAALLCTVGTDALAQIAPSSDPAQIERRFDMPVRPTPAPSAVEGLDRTPAVVSREDRSKRFTLRAVEIEGVTIYEEAQFNALFAEYIGKEVSMAQVQDLAAQITSKYRGDGYILSQAVVSGQSGGRVKIRVFEGFVSNVIIEGEHVERPSHHLVESYGEKIKADRPLRISTLERYLLLIDDLPGVTAKGVLRPSPNTVGAAELVVLLDHKKFGASLNTNNRGTRFIGRNQHQATLTANSLLGLYDRTVLRGITASPIEELKFFDIQHEEQLGTEGAKAIFTAGWAHTEPGDILKVLDIEGDSESYVLELNKPVIRSRKENLTPRIRFNWRDTENEILGVQLNEDKLRVLRLGAQYDRTDSHNGVNLVDAELSQGLDIFDASDSGDLTSRPDGEADFTKINLTVSRLQALPNNFSILAAATGQYSLDPLLAAEEFSLGGEGFGQAYDPSEIAGDHGAAMKLELRYGRGVDQRWLSSYQLYTYYDLGAIWQDEEPAGTDDKESLAAAGVGVRANFTPWLSGTGEVAFPLTRDVANEGDDDTRLFFSVTGRF